MHAECKTPALESGIVLGAHCQNAARGRRELRLVWTQFRKRSVTAGFEWHLVAFIFRWLRLRWDTNASQRILNPANFGEVIGVIDRLTVVLKLLTSSECARVGMGTRSRWDAIYNGYWRAIAVR